MDDHRHRRIDDSVFGRAVKLWPMAFGIFGVIYALITNYNLVKNNADSIYKLNVVTDGLSSRIAAIEKDMAVKNSQFTVILSRTDRIEDKLDKLIAGKR